VLLQRQVARTFGADAVDLLLRYQVRPPAERRAES